MCPVWGGGSSAGNDEPPKEDGDPSHKESLYSRAVAAVKIVASMIWVVIRTRIMSNGESNFSSRFEVSA